MFRIALCSTTLAHSDEKRQDSRQSGWLLAASTSQERDADYGAIDHRPLLGRFDDRTGVSVASRRRYGSLRYESIVARKRPARKRPTSDVEKRVLIQSARRCALCSQLDGDARQKKGQIAHLDRRRANSIEDNLAFLCLEHHSEYDSTTRQHKNYTIDEVKAARSVLYEWVKKGMPPTGARSRNAVVGPGRTRASAVQTRDVAHSQLPDNRPKVAPSSYGVSQDDWREGLHLTNEGTPAHDARIETIILRDGWNLRFDEISGPLERSGFSRAWVSCGNRGSTSLDSVWFDLNKSSKMPAIFPLIVTYKDFDCRLYRSVCELHRDVLKKSGFDVTFIRQERIEHQESSSLAPILSYEGITSGGDYAFTHGPLNLQVVTIRNTQLALKNTAHNVNASIEYNHAGGDRFCIRDALWIVAGRRYHIANLSGNEAQKLVLLSRAKDRTLFASFDENYFGRELDVGHWSVRITITGDNCEPLVLDGGFTILPDDGKGLVYDQPALCVMSSTH